MITVDDILKIICPINGLDARSVEGHSEPVIICKHRREFGDCEAHDTLLKCQHLTDAERLLGLFNSGKDSSIWNLPTL